MDSGKIKDHLKQDAVLKPIVEQIVLPQLHYQENVYKELTESIISQQLSTKVAAIITQRFLDLLNSTHPTPEAVLRLGTEEKRSVGLSYQKVGYIDNIARFWLEHNLMSAEWQELSDQEIMDLLTQIKGVGKWTVEMVLIFSLLRKDVFPHDDLGIRQQMVKLYSLESTGKQLIRDMSEIAEAWKPYRSVASRYLWKSKDL